MLNQVNVHRVLIAHRERYLRMARRSSRRFNCRQRINVRIVALPERKSPATPEEPFRPSLNAMLLMVVILLAAIWTWMYSDWFAVFSGTVGLTALISVVPTLRGYMTSDRNKKWGAWIDELLFQSRTATRLYPIAIIMIIVIGFGLYQPLAIKAPETASADTVTISLFKDDDEEPMDVVRVRVEPGGVQRRPSRRPFIGGPDRLVAKSSALPLLEHDMTGLQWRAIDYPFDFWAEPAMLLYPAPTLLAAGLRDKRHDLRIAEIRGEDTQTPCVVQTKYLGEPVWLGTGGRALPVSGNTLMKWRESAALHGARIGMDDLAAQVIATALAPDCLKSLGLADAIEWSLIGSDGTTLQQGRLPIQPDEAYPILVSMEANQ